MAGHDGYTRYTVRIPDALYERVKAAAGEASVNSLIVKLLEEKFPMQRIDLSVISTFLDCLLLGPSEGSSEEEKEAYRNLANVILGRMPHPYRAEECDGAVTFYPGSASQSEFEGSQKFSDIWNKYYAPALNEVEKRQLEEALKKDGSLPTPSSSEPEHEPDSPSFDP